MEDVINWVNISRKYLIVDVFSVGKSEAVFGALVERERDHGPASIYHFHHRITRIGRGRLRIANRAKKAFFSS